MPLCSSCIHERRVQGEYVGQLDACCRLWTVVAHLDCIGQGHPNGNKVVQVSHGEGEIGSYRRGKQVPLGYKGIVHAALPDSIKGSFRGWEIWRTGVSYYISMAVRINGDRSHG